MASLSQMSGAFMTLDSETEHREDIKGSVFIAHAGRADTPDQAIRYLQGLIQRYPDASHLAWAWRMGPRYRFSDGGEPTGTAGQPIYRAIEGQGLDHVVAGVIRYFGGTLLGAGGLMRAYGGTAAEALRQGRRREEWPRVTLRIGVSFAAMGALYRLLDDHAATDRTESYDEQGIAITCQVASHRLEALQTRLKNATRDQFTLQRIEAP